MVLAKNLRREINKELIGFYWPHGIFYSGKCFRKEERWLSKGREKKNLWETKRGGV
jgi:hypothetical protein